jgi:hypothetical protein
LPTKNGLETQRYFLSLTEDQFVMETLSILYFGGEQALSQGKVQGKCQKLSILCLRGKNV